MKAIIIGGGIGGATAAIALTRAGIAVEVYERAPQPSEVGAGISLWANALRALKAIDAEKPVLARGEAVTQAQLRTWRGRVLQSVSMSELPDGTPPILLIHRAELLDALLARLPPGVMRFGHECLGVNEAKGSARFSTSRGVVEAAGDLVIGADGINSVVRAGLLSDGRPRYAGYTAWRAVAHIPESLVPAGYCWETWGRGVRFGITRIGQGRVYWWAAKNAPEGGRDNDAKAALLETYRDWASPVPQIIEMTARDAIFRNDIIDRVPVRGWSRGRVTLVGDAAHPTTPNLGQGGCQAIEDGVVLAKKLSGTADVAAALRNYEHARYARAAMVTKASWRFGVAGHWENPLACWVRDTTASLIPGAVLLRQQQSLMHFSIE